MSAFLTDARLAATSAEVATLAVCEVRLAQDRRWPWLVLVPRRPGLRELTDLVAADRALLWSELDRAERACRAVGGVLRFEVEKLNVAALGNVVPQLHVHVIGRRAGDPAWPGPVWNVGEAEPYDRALLARACEAARNALG